MEKAKNAAGIRFLAVVLLLMGLAVVFGFAQGWLPEVHTSHGKGIDRTIRYLMVSTGILYVVSHFALSYMMFQYAKDEPRANAKLNKKLEAKVAIVPVVLMMAVSEVGVLVMGLPVFGEVYGDAPEDAYEVEVVGKQFEWLVRYPGPDGIFGQVRADLVHDSRNPLGLDKKDPAAKDDIVARGIVNIPVDRTTVVHLRSLDVIHSFTVPLFRVKQDTLPGFTARAMFKAETEGTFELACAELCGLGHYRMQGKVVVKTEEDLAQWLSEQEPWL